MARPTLRHTVGASLKKKKRHRDKDSTDQKISGLVRSSANDQSKQQQHNGDSQPEASKDAPQVPRLTKIRDAIDELTIQRLGLIVAVGLLVATWYQALLSRQGVRAVERAYVVFGGMDGWHFAVAETPETHIAVTNDGHTEAENLNFKVFIRKVPQLPPTPEYWDTEVPAEQSYPPGVTIPPGKSHILTLNEGRPMNDETRRAIDSNEIRYYVYGYALYEDVFRTSHITGFCGRYDPTKTPDSQGRQVFEACLEPGYMYQY